MSQIKEEIEELLVRYYRLLDGGAPVEALQACFHSEGFEIVERPMRIDSLEAYADWYEMVNATYADRRHTVEGLVIDDRDEGGFTATIQMHFTARRMGRDGEPDERVSVKARILWGVNRDVRDHQMKISKYHVYIQEA